VVGGVVVGGVPPLQTVPFNVNCVGFGLLPLQAPLNPIVVLAPLASAPLYDSFFAVTFWPLCDQMADQPCCTRWLLFGKVKPRVHELSGSPRFLIVTFAVKPPGQSLVV